MMKNDTLPPEKQRQQQEYNDYVKQVTPTYSLWGNMAKAFIVGGVICCIGQGILNAAKAMGADFCAVLTGIQGQSARGFFEEQKAEYILNSIEDFLI